MGTLLGWSTTSFEFFPLLYLRDSEPRLVQLGGGGKTISAWPASSHRGRLSAKSGDKAEVSASRVLANATVIGQSYIAIAPPKT